MKKLIVSFDGIYDDTGYLFSFAKCLSAAVKNSPYADLFEDIIATSGFAFRMWVDGNSLCPSATSIWSFDSQKNWVENGGLLCDYVGRYWGQDEIEQERRLQAIDIIKKSIDNGIAAIVWDISGCEWGLITGYEEEQKKLFTLKANCEESEITYDLLGKMEIPILSVLTITGRSNKSQDQIIEETIKLAKSHYKGEEWCENAKGLDAYPALIGFIEEKFTQECSCSLDYYLGTYGGLKYYAWKFFEKYDYLELSELYKRIYQAWKSAFDIKQTKDIIENEVKNGIIILISNAYELEKKAFELMKSKFN
ncbi:MAG: hypothetical protein K0Q49_2513 [Haloplasmataceae bacterium]|jgi:hypothetical protein|nr:hypothetical protein [Haloplasmataceae bacterium]